MIAKLEDYNFPRAIPPKFSNRNDLDFPPRIKIFRENYLTQSNGMKFSSTRNIPMIFTENYRNILGGTIA